MFSSSHSLVREKQFLIPRRKVGKNGPLDQDVATMTDNHILFMAQQARVKESMKPLSPLRRLFRRS